MKFKAVKLAQLLSGAYILIVTFTQLGLLGSFGGARDPISGFVIDLLSEDNTKAGVVMWNGDLRAIAASTTPQMLLLGCSRFSGFFMYPALILVFLTKLRATCAFLSSTMLNMYLYQDLHRLHVYCGWVILLDSCLHITCHLTRWLLQGNLSLLWTHTSGFTGLIVILSTALICCPMIFLKDRIKYEMRKLAHYLFLAFGVAMCFHAPKSAVPNGGFCGYIFPTLLIWYALDYGYCCFFRTELIETTSYQTLPSGVQMTMAVSTRFQNCGGNGGYAYVCFPWVDRNQWHAFSLFEKPGSPQMRQIFMQKTGDWTTKVHDLLQRDSVRPVWIQGPFPSPYKNAMNYDNQILVAAGIGITPALSVIRAHQDYRRINLIWAVRDPAMLEFFLSHAYLDHRGWNLIFYTGKVELPKCLMDSIEDTNVVILNCRPDIRSLIPNIIYGIESGVDESETYFTESAKNDEMTKMLSRGPSMDLDMDLESGGFHGAPIVSMEKDIRMAFDSARRPSSTAMKQEQFQEEFPVGPDNRKPQSRATTTTHDNSGSFQDDDASSEMLLQRARVIRRKSSIATQGTSDSIISGDSPPEEIRKVLLLGATYKPFMKKRDCNVLMQAKDASQCSFQPWETHPTAEQYVKNLDNFKVKKTWGVLYCGGKNKLLEGLKAVTTDIGVKLHEESFNW